MASLDELRDVRVQKLSLLAEFGMDAFPASVVRTHTLSDVVSNFNSLEQSQELVSIVGRIL
jgi:lysyl-tRNA synthetase class II